MGAKWKDTPSGRHGAVGCYSTQTFKHINSGEGGLLITDDPELMARATMLSGSYMLYGHHAAGAPVETFENISLDTPNCSGRMDNLRAAILRPQLAALDAQAEKWNERYRRLELGLQNITGLRVIPRPPEEYYVASSFQFTLPNWAADNVYEVQTRCAKRGVDLKWFGADKPSGFTSRHDSWRYVDAQKMPQTDQILTGLLDMRLPLTFTLEDCDQLTAIIREEVGAVYQASS
jgi:dTDP-4-amino-4,6-dideoxygalactose transaminase